MYAKPIENLDLILCEKHNGNIILFSLEEAENIRDQLLCVECMSEKTKIAKALNWTDVKSMIQEQKQKRFKEFDQSLHPIIGTILQFSSIINQMKEKVMTSFDQINSVSQSWMQEIEEQKQKGCHYSIFKELEIVKKELIGEKFNSIDQHIEELKKCNRSNLKQLKNAFKQLNFNEQLRQFQDCMAQVQQFVESDFQLNAFPVQQFIQNGATEVKCQCPQHNRAITMINLDKNVFRDQRTLCGNCQLQNVITLQNFEERWKKYQQDRYSGIEKKKNEFENGMDHIKKQIKALIEYFTKNLDQTYRLIEKKIVQIRQRVVIKQKERQEISSLISLNQLQDFAEELSKFEENTNAEQEQPFDDEVLKSSKELLDKILEVNSAITNQISELILSNQTTIIKIGFQKISYRLTQEIEQKEWCGAIAINFDGKIMAAGSHSQILLWKLENNKLQSLQTTLNGHTKEICCLIFSKNINYLISGSYDNSIRCWSEVQNIWSCLQTLKQHSDHIECLILNQEDNQLLSCSLDKSIKVWNKKSGKNELIYDYSLNKHTDCVYCISLNKDEKSLVSCSKDKQIIVWGKDKDLKWQFKQVIQQKTNDFGMRVSFIDLNTIAWQQYKKGITHIFELENGLYLEKPELQIVLNQEKIDNCFFPSIFNWKRKIFIQKHNKFVYIIRKLNTGLYQFEQQPINCNSDYNFGGLSNNGENLVIWNDGTYKLQLYSINYE